MAWAWTTPLEISAPSGNERSTPRVIRGASGAVHVAYVNKGSPWQVLYRLRNASGNWGAVEGLSSVFATRPDVTEDGQGRPHVVYAGTNTGGALDLVHVYKTTSGWVSSFITTSNEHEDQPHVVTDSLGRIHMVFTRTASESSSGNVLYRLWNGSSWGAELTIGHVDNSYYRRPDIAVDAADNVHVVWGDKSGSIYKIRYTKYNGSSWSTPVDVGSADGTGFPSYAKVAATGTNVLVVWDDTSIVYNYSNNGGANWAFGLSGNDQGQTLSGDRSPSLDARSGQFHLISTLAPNNRGISYSQFNGTTWLIVQQVVFSNSNWKGWTDCSVGADGNIHAVWDDAYGSDTNQHCIAYSSSMADTTPPAPVTGLTAVAGHNQVTLGWTNPFDPDFQRTIIRMSTTGYPATVNDGTLLADRPNTAGSSDSFVHASVVNGTRYYYSVFTKDVGGLYSSPVQANATPFVPADIDRDGDVDQSDFGLLQACMTGMNNAQNDLSCQAAKMDGDADVDTDDAVAWVECLSGAGVSYVPSCAG